MLACAITKADHTIKIFVGTDKNGERLKAAIRREAEAKYFGNMSRLLMRDFCEKYGYDHETGMPIQKCSTGAPQDKMLGRIKK